ncbi:hypothetical protein KY362_05205 [Candidatus Woesearchaeota archaeon]|nr:hypothetical protein [Candidatus Woesearchaeota archaeon]
MAEPNTKQVEAIYEGAHHAPHIETLGIGDAFGRSKDAYFRAVEQILEKVPAAIERQLFGDL